MSVKKKQRNSRSTRSIKKQSKSALILAKIKDKANTELELQIMGDLEAKMNTVESRKKSLAEAEKDLKDYMKRVDQGAVKLRSSDVCRVSATSHAKYITFA